MEIINKDKVVLVRNDIGMSVEQAMEILAKDGVELSYGNFKIIVERQWIKEAITALQDQSPEELGIIKAGVDIALRKELPKMERFSTDPSEYFVEDLVLWEALKSVKKAE